MALEHCNAPEAVVAEEDSKALSQERTAGRVGWRAGWGGGQDGDAGRLGMLAGWYS